MNRLGHARTTRPPAWLVACLLAFAVGVGGAFAAPATPPASVEQVVVILKAQASLTGITGPRATRLREVIRRRQVNADSGYAAFRARMAAWRQTGQITAIKRFWVFNGFAITATPAVVAELTNDPAVARVSPDTARIVPSATGPTEWNVALAGAPTLWNLGDTGQGVVVASLDSGVDAAHPDLSGSWRGGANSWFDPFGQHPTVPTDLSGHGTQVMGVIVGGGAGGTALGVAPGAHWIAARIFNDQGTSTLSATHQAFQWLLDPDRNPATNDAPQVVNGSWSFASGGCNLEFAQDVQSLRSAGILPVFAAGNFGTVSASPANNPGAFAVGSTTNTDAIATDSSRGPSACGEPSTTFPELTAPGVGIHTTDLGGLYTTQSGTSLAAPHVAGALALLLSAHPTLTPAQQETALERNAVDLGVAGPDNTFGYGRLDIVAAYQSIGPPPPDSVGPVVSGVAAAPDVTAAAAVALTATAVDVSGTTARAEWFDGADPGAGNGTAMTAADGAFNQPTEALTATIDAGALAPGAHTIGVRARDAAGNWGGSTTTTLVIDRLGPLVSGVSAAPNPVASGAVALTASSADGSSTVAAAEWFDGAAAGAGTGTAMTAADGTFNQPTEALTATIDSGALAPGAHTIGVRARDVAGNWGAPITTTLVIDRTDPVVTAPAPSPHPTSAPAPSSSDLPPGIGAPVGVAGTPTRSNLIFSTGFEHGKAALAITGAGRLAFVSAANMAGTGGLGMKVTLSGAIAQTTPASTYVTDDSPVVESTYNAHFSFNPNHSTPGGGADGITLLAGYTADNGRGTNCFTVRYRQTGRVRQVRLNVRSGRTIRSTKWFAIPTAAPTPVDVSWRAGAAHEATLRLKGRISQTLTGLNTEVQTGIESVRFGVQGLSRSSRGRRGSLYLDSFVSTRHTAVGP